LYKRADQQGNCTLRLGKVREMALHIHLHVLRYFPNCNYNFNYNLNFKLKLNRAAKETYISINIYNSCKTLKLPHKF